MSDEDEDTKDALAKLGVGPAAAELYADLLRPAAREIGTNLNAVAKVITLALSPLHGLVWGMDRIRDWLSVALLKRLATVSPEDIKPPKAHIAGQALLQLSLCAEEEHLRELYANLLASAMSSKTAPAVHPAFVHVIQQLTPDEALILNHLAHQAGRLELQEEFSDRGMDRFEESISKQFGALCAQAGVGLVSHSDDYLDNLLRLRILVETPYNEGELLKGTDRWDEPSDAVLVNRTGRVIEISSFGEKFLSTCVNGTVPSGV